LAVFRDKPHFCGFDGIQWFLMHYELNSCDELRGAASVNFLDPG